MGYAKDSPRISSFPSGHRASGLLLHITSLPSPHGIGDLGPAAFEWIDRLHDSGQSWWQTLPFGPTGLGDSPYSGLSSFGGNGMLISPEFLIEDGLLARADCQGKFPSDGVDYASVVPYKHRLLKIAWANFRRGARKDLLDDYDEFCYNRKDWLEDYSLFRALKAGFDGAPFQEWPDDMVQRVPQALVQARRDLSDEIDQVRLAQFLLFRQASRVKRYARARSVRLIGDLPAFVSADSSDVWAHPEIFLLDEHRRPRVVAGVPPDYFSTHGQLWGNPLYDWEFLARTGYAWWIERLRVIMTHVDLVRLDHFRAFAAAWHIPAGALTAEAGQWVRGPGAELFHAVRRQLGAVPFVAEDLGIITPDVCALRDEFGIPGTRVLQYAFDGDPNNAHLPNNYPANAVAYTGTHDNPTTREWYTSLPDRERHCLWRYAKKTTGDVHDAAPELMRLAWSSSAAIAIAPLQDLLNLGPEARMNIPGNAQGNWSWRATPEMLCASNFEWLKELTNVSDRTRMDQVSVEEAAL